MLPKFLKIDIDDARTMQNLPNTVWAFFGVMIRPYKWHIATVMFLNILGYIGMAIIPLFIKYIVDALEVSTPETIWSDLSAVLFWGVLLCLIGQPVASRLAGFYSGYLYPRMAGVLRSELAMYMQDHSWGYYQNDFAGRLSAKVSETPKAIRRILRSSSDQVIGTLTNFIASLILAWMAHPVFGVVYLVWISIFIGFALLFVPTVQRLSNKASDTGSIMLGRFVDILSNILLVKLFARKKYEMKHLKKTISDTSYAYNYFNYRLQIFWSWLELISVVFVGVSVFFCIWGWQNEVLSAGDIAMILPLVLTSMNYSWWMADVLTEVFENVGIVEEGMQAIVRPRSVEMFKNRPHLAVDGGEIAITNLDFGYKSNTEVMDNFNLTIPAGQKVGLVGQSGAGKTTLVNLLLHLFEVKAGSIAIDGQNIADVSEESLREAISLIPQDTTLFHRTLSENIAYGKPDATTEDIQTAAAKAYASEFISAIPKGYNAMVGERGLKLSGGQRQRIAMARAILKDAPILILDEATSALDSASERYIQKSLEDLMVGKTVIAVAHRLSTLAQMDRILVMENGKIIEDGSHKQLLSKKGAYAKLWAMQSEGFLPE